MEQIDNIFLGLPNNSEIKNGKEINTITRNTSCTWETINTVYMTERNELERTFIPR